MKKPTTSAAPLAAIMLAACLAGAAAAHPFHVSVAECEWNADSGALEVSLRVAPEDLERALSRRAKSRVSLDTTDDVDALAADYLREAFTLAPPGADEPLELKWIGKEVTTKTAWLYFEIAAPDGVAGLELTNRALVEVEPTQINTVNIRARDQRTSLRLDRKRPTAAIEFASEAEQEARK